MARRWTPQRFVKLRRIRIATCAVVATLLCIAGFGITARKTVALTVNGETRTVTTYAMSVARLLQEQGVNIKTHDVVTTASGDNRLNDHSVVTVQSAYQATIDINGQQVPFWTVATSADQLIGFFRQNDQQAAKVTVNVTNVYNQLTGGLIINKAGPVTVIADGKTSVAPDGKLPAASILDSKGIVLHKEDRVSVEQHGSQMILRVQRVTHGQQTQRVIIPYGTQTVVDPSLAPGDVVIRQAGKNGEKTQVYDTTYVDGVEKSRSLVSETTTATALDRIVAVGPNIATSGGNSGGSPTASPTPKATPTPTKPSNSPTASPSPSSNSPSTTAPQNPTSSPNSPSPSQSSSTPQPSPSPSPNPPNNGGGANTGLWHPSASQAQVYAAGAAAQYGWTGQKWKDLVTLWNRESSWLWNAENAYSGAYGIPQSLPGSKMADFGANWRDDASIQIAWGLNYISLRYGDPSTALQHSNQTGWY